MDRWQEKENREFLRAGTIAAASLNPYRDSKSHPEPFTAYDIFALPRPPAPPRPKLSKAEVIARLDPIFKARNARLKKLEDKMARKKRSA